LWCYFIRLGNFFNSEIIGKETTSTFGIRFLRDQFTPDAVNATQIANPNDAYKAIATEPQFTNLLAQVPVKHPTQLYEGFYIFVFAIFSCTGKQRQDKNLDTYLAYS
jgi:prolipoprotein diacylglyceryltransferase